MTITLDLDDTDRLADVLLALVQRGLTFRCTVDPTYPGGRCWLIQLTGGY